ncbi:MAG TPA: 50S ribosomal protein L20 [Patescibacteria group bacterium]|nr:50S ribosomal protein L20 [Patescibacteria group bacterium]
MARVKTGIVRRKGHKAVLARTKGFRMTRNRLFKVAKEAELHAGQYAFIGRRLRKRDLRSLWITRIGAALKQIDEKLKYSVFIKNLKDAKVELDRKILADLAAKDGNAFKAVVKKVTK